MSAAALVSLIIVLEKYDQQPTPSWPLGITLNTLLAFLTAVSQAGFVNPVYQGLSQMKWNWFSDSDRPLADFAKFDGASRGIWGGVLLVFSMKGRLSVFIATVILLSSTVTSTVTQATLTQGTRYTPSSGGTAAIKAMSNDFASVINNETIANKILSAALAPISTTYGSTVPTCTSGDCDFPIFSSLAVCVDTNDITDDLVLEEAAVASHLTGADIVQGSRATLAKNDNNIWLLGEYEVYLNSTSPDGLNWSEIYTFSNTTFEYSGISMAQLIYLNATGYNVSGIDGTVPYDNATLLFMPYVRAVEAMFYMCVQTYNVTTRNGTTQTTITSTAANFTPVTDGGEEYRETHVGLKIGDQDYVFATNGIPATLNSYFLSIITGSYPSEDTLSGWSPFPSSLGLVLYPSGDTLSDQTMFQNIELLLGNMAREITNWMRSTYGGSVQGQNYTLSTYIIVRWHYIVLLAAQVGLSLIFLAWIILDTRRRKIGVLKDGALPTLFALSAEDRLTLQNRVSVTTKATKTKTNGWRNAVEDVGASSGVYLASGDFGQWFLRLAK